MHNLQKATIQSPELKRKLRNIQKLPVYFGLLNLRFRMAPTGLPVISHDFIYRCSVYRIKYCIFVRYYGQYIGLNVTLNGQFV